MEKKIDGGKDGDGERDREKDGDGDGHRDRDGGGGLKTEKGVAMKLAEYDREVT